MQLIIMKTKSKMKIDSHRYGINLPGCRHKHKYSKYIKSLSIMMLICVRQHLSNIWSLFYDDVKQHRDWVERKHCLLKISV